jgi:hypothetical protein
MIINHHSVALKKYSVNRVYIKFFITIDITAKK